MNLIAKPQRGFENLSKLEQSLMDTLMNEALQMSSHQTSVDTPNATSSQVSEAGLTPSNSPDGLQVAQCGREAALANPSAKEETLGASQTRETYGLRSTNSSASAVLSMFLGSRLIERLSSAGSTDYAQTWRQMVTPAGLPFLAHIPKLYPHPRQRLFWAAHTSGKLDSGAQLPKARGSGSIPTIWQSEKIEQEGQGRVDELVARHVAERVSSYSEAMSILDGIPGRMVGIRGAGNAIVPQVAAEFVAAFMDVTE